MRYFRLRIETGGSMLSLPNSTAVSLQEWRGKTLYGPDVGVSGQLGIVGPLGIEGHARLTPIPMRVADTLIAATVHGGPLGLSAGWRWIDVAGNGRDAPEARRSGGPRSALSLAFRSPRPGAARDASFLAACPYGRATSSRRSWPPPSGASCAP